MREFIWYRELALSHKLEQMRRVRMLEKQAAWKEDGCFDSIDIIAEMHEQTLRRLHAGFDLKPLYNGLYNPRWPPNPIEFTLEMSVEVDILGMEVLFAQLPTPPQYLFSVTVACGRYVVGRTRSAARCNATNKAGGNLPFSSRCQCFLAC